MLFQILLIFYLLFFVVGLIYIGLNWSFILHKNDSLKSSNTEGISVIVCAKNEENRVGKLLDKLKNQDYNKFEIVLVNDKSTDSTLEIFERFASSNSNVEVVNVEENFTPWKGKKFALTLGIKRSKYETLIFTDADCIPKSDSWISSIANSYNENTKVVLGYGPYSKSKGFLNKLIRFETIQTAANYFSYALSLNPYMGVGRNLSYKKSLFFDNRGFYSHMDVASGDDDLFINECAEKKSTTILYSEESQVVSDSVENFGALINQKRRHYSTSSRYSGKTKFLLGLQVFSKLMFYTLFIMLLFFQYETVLVLISFSIYIIINFITFTMISLKFKEKDLIAYLLFLDIFLIYFQLSIQVSNKISYPKRWA